MLEDLENKENGSNFQPHVPDTNENSNESEVEKVDSNSKTEANGNLIETPDSEEIVEECLYVDECTRKFSSYFSMMRHVAFFHRPERTAELMKLKLTH